MMETKEEVAAALAREPKRRADGRVLCQVCGEAFPRQGIGPHQIKHRLAVGLLERRRAVALPKGARIPCPECGDRLLNYSLVSHLRNVHDYGRDESVNAAQRIRRDFAADLNGDGQPSRAVVPVKVEPDEPESPWHEISAVDATTDILARARKDGQVPIKLLPEIFEWMVSTGTLLHRLERLSR